MIKTYLLGVEWLSSACRALKRWKFLKEPQQHVFDSVVKEIHPRDVSRSFRAGRGCLPICVCVWVGGVVSPSSVYDSNLFKKFFTKTKNGLGKVRKSLAVKKDKAVDEEVRLFLVWYAKRVTNQFLDKSTKLASCSFSHHRSIGGGMPTCQAQELENVTIHQREGAIQTMKIENRCM